MGLMDLFKAKENESLKKELEETKKLLSPELLNVKEINQHIKELEEKKTSLENEVKDLESEQLDINKKIEERKSKLIILDEDLLMQDFSLYQPIYDFATSEKYKEKLDSIRREQKRLIKDKTAVNYFDGWTVDGSKAKGKKMTDNNIKQIIRSFNTECENVIDRVKFSNIDSMKKRIIKAFQDLNKINTSNRVELTEYFLHLKLEELNLAYEYQVKKQEEKEELKRTREELREQARLQKELDSAKKNIDKDLKHFNNALNSLMGQLENKEISEEQRQALINKKSELEDKISELDKNLKDIDYRQNNQKAGYVYIISNIGTFGENIYKIGMTRRLDPQDRVDELGGASVPFNFDVHAMIFTEDAPKLENALHKAFENKKVNMINSRREFFNVTLEEIEDVVKKSFDKTVEFKKIAEAEQFRQSLKIKNKL
ncbi:DUF4041 domain-containing protein [Clostridium tarantellae]|uniref:DUF4041 domain-containing protein n=1 Tax=Clostridium tarantellae TaxID=39493 RepID=A0A6I1MX89_9CLOT|nr:DUF4041 domain-containing protein [Clostridium tarantellae]MPQ44769.1 DUF4041 domain-containing protein [Clostridium tarantellae]